MIEVINAPMGSGMSIFNILAFKYRKEFSISIYVKRDKFGEYTCSDREDFIKGITKQAKD